MSKREAVVYGRRACIAVGVYRPESILRVLYDEKSRTKDLGPLLKICATHRRPYRSISPEELERVSGSTHHEGVVVITQRLPRSDLERSLERVFERSSDHSSSDHSSDRLNDRVWVALDGVANDHNLGAIARTLAWFGGGGLIWEGAYPHLSGAALRVAQGGAEIIELVAVNRLPEALDTLRSRGVYVIGADQSSRGSAFNINLSGPICWVLGSEQFGLSKVCRDRCDALVSIPGAGHIESLNVSVSAGILISQSYTYTQRDSRFNKDRFPNVYPKKTRGERGGRAEGRSERGSERRAERGAERGAERRSEGRPEGEIEIHEVKERGRVRHIEVQDVTKSRVKKNRR